jgi:hypothetical protein
MNKQKHTKILIKYHLFSMDRERSTRAKSLTFIKILYYNFVVVESYRSVVTVWDGKIRALKFLGARSPEKRTK